MDASSSEFKDKQKRKSSSLRLKILITVLCLVAITAGVNQVIKIQKRNTPEGLFQTGNNYYYGRDGYNRNYKKAFECYLKAYNKGYTGAEAKLAKMYIAGQGVKKDVPKGIKLIEKATANANAQGKFNLGYSFDMGIRGMPQNYKRAMYWYRQSAAMGKMSAKFNIATLYNFGRGVPTNYKEAVSWYEKSAKMNDHGSEERIGNIYNKGGYGIKKDSKKAREWWAKAAKAGNKDAQMSLGFSYALGDGENIDIAKAIYWFKKAQKNGCKLAGPTLASLLFTVAMNDDTKVNEAVNCCRNLLKNNCKAPSITFFMGSFYFYGRGVEQDYQKAFSYFKESADKNFSEAVYMIGFMYYKGYGVKQNRDKGIELITKAEKMGCKKAEYLLALINSSKTAKLPVRVD